MERYYVLYHDDDGRWCAKGPMEKERARGYRDGIALNREPRIVIELSPILEVSTNRTKADIVKSLDLKDFDYSLPQEWVNAAKERGWDVVPHFVWSYDNCDWGEPYPLTEEGHRILRQMAKYI